MTTLGEVVPEKIDWLEEESDGEEEAEKSHSDAGPSPDAGRDAIRLQRLDTKGESQGSPETGQKPPVVTPVYESFAAQVKRYAQRIKDEYPETDPGRADEQATMLVKNERRQKALEAEGAARAEAPDYDTGSQEVRRGRRR